MPVQAQASSTAPLKFGMDRDSLQGQAALGVPADYAQYWAGVWNEAAGWAYLGTWADDAADRGATPVVEWWYWGDDISTGCVANGCMSALHDRWKSRAGWNDGARKLADALHAGLQGRPGVVVIESEFNKGGIETWEDFDAYLRDHARIFRDHAPEVKLVLGFGNWAPEHWARFDRAAAAMDMVGFQTMRGSTRDSDAAYLGAVDAMKTAAAKLKALFGKPVLLHDLALSSYDGHEDEQERVIKALFSRRGELKAAGVTGVIYRGLRDDPGMDLANYYGAAERHMGLEHSDGSPKTARNDWVEGVKAERGTFAPGFTPKSVGNDWWVEVQVGSAHPVTKVEASINDGPYTALARTDWGTWAKALHAPDHSRVKFRATNAAGQHAYSSLVGWGGVAFSAGFEPRAVGNDHWSEVKVSPNLELTKVDVRVNGGAWQAMAKTGWGTWGRGTTTPDGAKVEFRAWTTTGATTISPVFRW